MPTACRSLADALSRNVFAGTPAEGSAEALAGYVLRQRGQLMAQPISDILAGVIAFEDPDQMEKET